MSIVHITPGLLDARGLTILGLHAKPNTKSPIGKFGSGLKYAVATLVRVGCKVQVFIGTTEYEFYTKASEFRGIDYNQVMMRKRKGLLAKWTYTELPFTTEFGKFWKPWQAFRELESNTRDEGGVTLVMEASSISPDAESTTIVVTGTPYEEAYSDRDKVFLPQALTKREGDDQVQVFNEPSNHIYWRGIRVFDLEKPSVYTYNILVDMTLTEDRTLAYVWDAQSKIAAYVARSNDRKLINTIVSADAERFFEGRLDWDFSYASPSEAFKEIVAKRKARGSYISPRALSYYDRYVPAVVEDQSLMGRISRWAYDESVPEGLRELLKHLLNCEIKERATVGDDDLPF